MSLMKVDLYGVYRLSAGRKTLEIEVTQDLSIRDLLNLVEAQLPPLHGEFFDAEGNVYSHIPMYLNGRNPRLLVDGFGRIIRPDDVLSIFSPLSSGRINVEEANRLAHK